MESGLTPEALQSVKKSYFNILAFFFGQDQIETRFVRCLLKWGFQLHLTPHDINHPTKGLEHLKFSIPDEKVKLLEEIYYLACMINLDNVVEDVELEVASIYAQQLGFKASLVPDLFKSITTAVYDGMPAQEVKREVLEFLNLNKI
jgi:hypothetical protein